jgi:hypothetical protein
MARHIIDAEREEPCQLAPSLIQHTKRRIPRIGELTARLEHSFKHDIHVELAENASSKPQQSVRPRIHDQRPGASAVGPVDARETYRELCECLGEDAVTACSFAGGMHGPATVRTRVAHRPEYV